MSGLSKKQGIESRQKAGREIITKTTIKSPAARSKKRAGRMKTPISERKSP
ncbi:MAG: hypothetical protein JW999_08590 [Methanotrichaceae archaeon]|nr:hypothetical protein [Methanotrichaceae archaeon]